MATTTRKTAAAKRRKESQEPQRTKARKKAKPRITVREKPGPDVEDWTCPACGWSKNSNADERCTSCDALRPEVLAGQVEVLGLENGRTAWECHVCQTHNDGRELVCLACDSIRGDLSDPEHMLLQALEPDRESSDLWRELRDQPTSDEKLTEAIHAALCRHLLNRVSTDRGYVSWVTGPENEALAGSIGIWFARQFPPESGTDPDPDLIGAKLLSAVRRLYGIPGRGHEAAQSPANALPILLSRDSVEALIESYSGDLICQGKIRKPMSIDGRRFVCVGIASSGRDGYKSVDFYEVLPRSQFRGKTTRRDRDFEKRRNDPLGFYHGAPVLCGNERLVLVGPEHRYSGPFLQKITAAKRAQETQQPRKKPKTRKPPAAAKRRTETQEKKGSGSRLSAVDSPLPKIGAWSGEEVERLRALVKEGKSNAEIARALGRSRDAVRIKKQRYLKPKETNVAKKSAQQPAKKKPAAKKPTAAKKKGGKPAEPRKAKAGKVGTDPLRSMDRQEVWSGTKKVGLREVPCRVVQLEFDDPGGPALYAFERSFGNDAMGEPIWEEFFPPDFQAVFS